MTRRYYFSDLGDDAINGVISQSIWGIALSYKDTEARINTLISYVVIYAVTMMEVLTTMLSVPVPYPVKAAGMK